MVAQCGCKFRRLSGICGTVAEAGGLFERKTALRFEIEQHRKASVVLDAEFVRPHDNVGADLVEDVDQPLSPQMRAGPEEHRRHAADQRSTVLAPVRAHQHEQHGQSESRQQPGLVRQGQHLQQLGKLAEIDDAEHRAISEKETVVEPIQRHDGQPGDPWCPLIPALDRVQQPVQVQYQRPLEGNMVIERTESAEELQDRRPHEEHEQEGSVAIDQPGTETIRHPGSAMCHDCCLDVAKRGETRRGPRSRSITMSSTCAGMVHVSETAL